MFCKRDIRTAFEDLVRMLREIKQRLGRPPKGGVYYSCLGRGAHMFGEDSVELKTIRQELGDIPLVVFSQTARFRTTGCTASPGC